VHFVFLIAAIKLFTLSKDRDYALLYLISFALLLAASILTVNLLFGVWYLAFLFSGIISLVLFEMRRSNARMQSRARVQPLVTPRKLQGTGFELFSPFPSRLLSGMMAGSRCLFCCWRSPSFSFAANESGLVQTASGKYPLSERILRQGRAGQDRHHPAIRCSRDASPHIPIPVRTARRPQVERTFLRLL